MRFTTAWANVSAQNVTLKFVIATLSFCVLASTVVLIKLSLKEPLIIEKACFSRPLSISSGKHSKEEIDAFLKEAMGMRFDSIAVVKPGFLTPEEEQTRTKEQIELTQRQMIQKIIFNSSVLKDNNVLIDSDRLISIGKIRSAFPFRLQVKLLDTTRTESNPYGLIINSLAPVTDKDSK